MRRCIAGLKNDYIYIEPIGKCNLRCKYCYVDFYSKSLPMEKVVGFIDKFNQIGLKEIYWCGGGEVMLYPNICEIINQYPTITHTIQTNGTILNSLYKINNWDNVKFNISIDGFKKTHEDNRGHETFEKSILFAKTVYNYGAKVEVRVLLTKDLDSMCDFVKWVKCNVGESVVVSKINPWNTNLNIPKNSCDDIFDKPPCQKSFYISLNPFGVFNCCECFVKIGTIDDNVELLFKKLSKSISDCENCKMYNECDSFE